MQDKRGQDSLPKEKRQSIQQVIEKAGTCWWVL